MINIVILLSLVCYVSSHDVIVGTNTEGRSIYNEVRHASPTIWRQTENVTITTSDAEVISRIVITDLRPEKDGDIKIVEGGEGQKNVTLELKSPTVLRGFDFRIEVFAIPEDKFKSNDNKEGKQDSDSNKTREPLDPNSKSSAQFPDNTQTSSTPAIETSTPARHAREADKLDVSKDQDTLKTNVNKDNGNARTPLSPVLTSRQGANIHNSQASTTTVKPESSTDGKRDARDTQDENKGSTTPKTAGPFVSSQAFNVPAVAIPRTNEPSNDTLERHAREAGIATLEKKEDEHQKTDHEDEDSVIKTPILISPGAINRRIPTTTTTNKPDLNGKRDARDTEDDQKRDTNSTLRPVIGNRFQPFNVPAVTNSKTEDNNNDAPKMQKREALNPELSEEKQNTQPKLNDESKNDKTVPQRPLIVSRQPFDRQSLFASTTNRPETSSEGKRDATDTEHDKTTSEKDNPSHPRSGLDATPVVNVKSTQTDSDITTEKGNTHKPRGHFVPPIGYKRVASTSDEKERVARDVEDKKLTPTFKTKDDSSESDDDEAYKQSSTTERNDSFKRPRTGLYVPRGTYAPRPYPMQVSTESPTTKSQNKRETENKDESSKKETEDTLKMIPRVLGNRNFTITEPKPVISVQ